MNAIVARPSASPLVLLPGLGLALVVALVALGLGRLAPLMGGPVIGIVLGIAVRNGFAPGARFTPGIRFAGKQVLQWSIIALGFGLGLDQVAQTGLESLAVTLVTMSTAFFAAWGLGRLLGVHGQLKVLTAWAPRSAAARPSRQSPRS